MSTGTFYGIGVGPGDPELITVKGARLIAACGCVVVPKSRMKRESIALAIAKRYISEGAEIVEQVYVEIKNYGHEEQKKKLIAGIVLTGGGSQLKHLKQLVEYITGMDTRIGFPNEHLAGDSDDEITSPLYATAVGLVLNSLEQKERSAAINAIESSVEPDKEPLTTETVIETEVPEPKPKDTRRFFDKWAEKFKEFLDHAE